MGKMEAEKSVVRPIRDDKPSKAQEERNREKAVRDAREQYRNFLDSINRSSDRDIDRAMSR